MSSVKLFFIFVFLIHPGAGVDSLDRLLREFKTLSNLKDVFLPPLTPDQPKPSLDLTANQVTKYF